MHADQGQEPAGLGGPWPRRRPRRASAGAPPSGGPLRGRAVPALAREEPGFQVQLAVAVEDRPGAVRRSISSRACRIGRRTISQATSRPPVALFRRATNPWPCPRPLTAIPTLVFIVGTPTTRFARVRPRIQSCRPAAPAGSCGRPRLGLVAAPGWVLWPPPAGSGVRQDPAGGGWATGKRAGSWRTFYHTDPKELGPCREAGTHMSIAGGCDRAVSRSDHRVGFDTGAAFHRQQPVERPAADRRPRRRVPPRRCRPQPASSIRSPEHDSYLIDLASPDRRPVQVDRRPDSQGRGGTLPGLGIADLVAHPGEADAAAARTRGWPGSPPGRRGPKRTGASRCGRPGIDRRAGNLPRAISFRLARILEQVAEPERLGIPWIPVIFSRRGILWTR